MNTVNLHHFQTVHGQSFADALCYLKTAASERFESKEKGNAKASDSQTSADQSDAVFDEPSGQSRC